MWNGFLLQTGQLTGLKLSRCVCRPWKPEIFLFQERTASAPVCTTFRAMRRKARTHGGCCSHGYGSPPCRQKELPYPPYEPQEHRTDGKYWHKTQYLPSVPLKNYTRMKVKLRSPLDPHHTQMPGYLFQMCHTSFSVPCNHPMRMLLQRKFAAHNLGSHTKCLGQHG